MMLRLSTPPRLRHGGGNAAGVLAEQGFGVVPYPCPGILPKLRTKDLDVPGDPSELDGARVGHG